MPSEAFGRARLRSAHPGSMPSSDANRSHSRPAADPRGGLVSTWIRSGGTCSAHWRRVASESCTRQNHHWRRSASTDSRSITSLSQSSQLLALRCLTVSCHSAGNSVAMSRTASTMCTSAGWSERTAVAACSGSAAENSSCEMTAVFPGCLAWLARISHSPVQDPAGSEASFSMPRRSWLARKWSWGWCPGSTTPWAASSARLPHITCWIKVVPVLGSPMCRKTLACPVLGAANRYTSRILGDGAGRSG